MINKYTVAVMLFLTVLAAGCSKNNDNNGSGVGIFRFYANGTPIQLEDSVAITTEPGAPNVLDISAVQSPAYGVASGGIGLYHGVGTYSCSNNSGNIVGFMLNGEMYVMSGNAMAPYSHGDFIITGETTHGNIKHAKGTFSGVAYASSGDSIVITNGQFQDMNY